MTLSNRYQIKSMKILKQNDMPIWINYLWKLRINDILCICKCKLLYFGRIKQNINTIQKITRIADIANIFVTVIFPYIISF